MNEQVSGGLKNYIDFIFDSEKKLDDVLKKLLENKKFDPAKFFQEQIDVNGVGYITINDFENNSDYALSRLYNDTKEKEVVGFWIPDDNDQISFTEVKEFGTKLKLVVDGKEEKYSLATGVKYYLNGDDIPFDVDDVSSTQVWVGSDGSLPFSIQLAYKILPFVLGTVV